MTMYLLTKSTHTWRHFGSNKYLNYVAEQAWRKDVRRLSTGKKVAHLFRVVISVGRSLWWSGYSLGRHREDELLIEGARSASSRKTSWCEAEAAAMRIRGSPLAARAASRNRLAFSPPSWSSTR